MAQSNVDIVREIYDAFAKGDVLTVLVAFAPDVVWTEFSTPGSPWGGTHHGPDGILQGVFMVLMANLEDVSVVPDEIIPAGDDKVLALGSFKGKGKATGKTFDTRFSHVGTFQDGKIIKMEIFEDVGTVVSTLS